MLGCSNVEEINLASLHIEKSNVTIEVKKVLASPLSGSIQVWMKSKEKDSLLKVIPNEYTIKGIETVNNELFAKLTRRGRFERDTVIVIPFPTKRSVN